MPGSPPFPYPRLESSIDSQQHMITKAPHVGAFLLSTYTTTYSKMYLPAAPTGRIPYPSCTSVDERKKMERLALACRSSSKELQHRLSIISDSDVPPLDDPFASSSDSEASISDPSSDPDSEGDFNREIAASQLWDSWWSPAKQNLELRQSFYQVTPPSFNGIPAPALSPCNRNFASSNLSDLTIDLEPHTDPYRKSEIHNSRHRSKSQSHLVRPAITSNTYAAFPTPPAASYTAFPRPPLPPKPVSYRSSPHKSHESWPPRSSSRATVRPSIRSRSNTTPAPVVPSLHNPSNLSFCTTIVPNSPRPSRHPSSSTTASDTLYMSSKSSKKPLPCFIHEKIDCQEGCRERPLNKADPQPLMNLMEKSEFVWDDDDDEKLGLMRSIDAKLHVRSQSGSAVKEDRGKRSLRMRMKARGAGLTFRGVFSRKSVG